MTVLFLYSYFSLFFFPYMKHENNVSGRGKIWGPKNVLKTNGILEFYFLVFVNQNCVYKARTRRNFELSFHFCTIDFDARISDSVYLRATKRESTKYKNAIRVVEFKAVVPFKLSGFIWEMEWTIVCCAF